MGAVISNEVTSFEQLEALTPAVAAVMPQVVDEEPLNLGNYMARFTDVLGGLTNRAIDGVPADDKLEFNKARAEITNAFLQFSSGNTTVNLDALMAKYADAYAKAGTYLPQEAV